MPLFVIEGKFSSREVKLLFYAKVVIVAASK